MTWIKNANREDVRTSGGLQGYEAVTQYAEPGELKTATTGSGVANFGDELRLTPGTTSGDTASVQGMDKSFTSADFYRLVCVFRPSPAGSSFVDDVEVGIKRDGVNDRGNYWDLTDGVIYTRFTGAGQDSVDDGVTINNDGLYIFEIIADNIENTIVARFRGAGGGVEVTLDSTDGNLNNGVIDMKSNGAGDELYVRYIREEQGDYDMR